MSGSANDDRWLRPAPSLRKDERGAVMVEFLVALMPLMITFSTSVQLTQIAAANLVVKHAAVVGARGAAVNSNGNQNTPEVTGDNHELVEQTVLYALGPWIRTMEKVDVQIDDRSSCDDPYGMVSVSVSAQYRCSVPFGGRLVCGSGKHSIQQAMSFPHQGARYADSGGTQCP